MVTWGTGREGEGLLSACHVTDVSDISFASQNALSWWALVPLYSWRNCRPKKKKKCPRLLREMVTQHHRRPFSFFLYWSHFWGGFLFWPHKVFLKRNRLERLRQIQCGSEWLINGGTSQTCGSHSLGCGKKCFTIGLCLSQNHLWWNHGGNRQPHSCD